MTILQELKIAKAKFATWSYRGYTIRVSPSSGKICVRETKWFTVKNAKVVSPNIISFQLLTRKDERWHVVGYYFPPFDNEGAASRLPTMEVLEAAPKGSKPLLIGNLNANLDFPRDIHEEILTANLGEQGLRCAA